MCKAKSCTDRRAGAECYLRAYRNYAEYAIRRDPKLAPSLRKILHAIHEAETALYECAGADARVCADACACADIVIYAAKCIIAPIILQK
jgi:hypothetical protein